MVTILLLLILQKILAKLGLEKISRKLRKRMKSQSNRLSVFVILLFISTGIGQAQTRVIEYDILKKGKSIGTLVAKKTVNGGITVYELHSRASAKILIIPYHIQMHQSGIFENGVLSEGVFKKEVNGKIKTRNEIIRKDSVYRILTHKNSMYELNSDIDYSFAGLYFNEPVGKNRIYSENFLQFVPVEKVALHRYSISFPDKTTNFYTYEGGICVSADIDTGIASIKFILKSNSQSQTTRK